MSDGFKYRTYDEDLRAYDAGDEELQERGVVGAKYSRVELKPNNDSCQ